MLNEINYCRERLKDPRKFDKASFRFKRTPRKGYGLIFACPKGKWNSRLKKCRVKMQLQAKLIPMKYCPEGAYEVKKENGYRTVVSIKQMHLKRKWGILQK